MKKYRFEIKYENNHGGKSFTRFNCKADNEKEARNVLSQYLIQSEYLGGEIELINN